jgi:uncharacterized delta-60 repeat protein
MFKLLYFIPICLVSLSVLAQPGNVDSSFGINGHVFLDINSAGTAYGVLIQPDKKILVSGVLDGHFAVGRFNSDGSIDNSFANGGVSTNIFPVQSKANCLALQSDGKILAGGYVDTGKNSFVIVRYKTDGTLDNSFCGSGKLTTKMNAFGRQECKAIVLQSDGKIVAAGSTGSYYYISRFWPDGKPDSSFCDTGLVYGNSNSELTNVKINSAAIQADGKILIMGAASTAYTHSTDFLAIRFKVNGQKDSTFGTNGDAVADFGGLFEEGYRGIVLSDQSILMGGYCWPSSGSNQDFALAKLKANGTMDSSFGQFGKVTTDLGGEDVGRRIALQPDGRILLAGDCNKTSTLVRFKPNGLIDSSFGINGVAKATFAPFGDRIEEVAMQPDDGKFVLVGWAQQTAPPTTIESSWLIARFEGGWGVNVKHVEASSNKVRLFPNPSSRDIHIENLTAYPVDHVDILSVDGKYVKRIDILNSQTISTDDIAPGNYHFRMFTKNSLIAVEQVSIVK